MKIIYKDWLNREIIDFLLSQDGINNVEITEENVMDCSMDCINVNSNLTPSIVAKFIDLFQENEFSNMFAFDKEQPKNIKTIIYNADDMCCEYCHMHFIRELFDNDNIISAKSNFSYDKSAFDIEYIICYLDTVEEKEIIDYIEKSL